MDIDRLQFLHKEDNMKYHRPMTKLALACLLFLVAAHGATPALAVQGVEALPHTTSVSEKVVGPGPSSAEEMEALLAFTVMAWMRGDWALLGRLYYSLVALASVLFVLFAGYWNLSGWRS
jgi:hypothetical protein